MKKEKMIIAVLCVVSIVLFMVGCSASPTPSTSAAASTEQSPATSAPASETASAAAPASAEASAAASKNSNIVIGFSNSYNGNSYRQCEEKAFKAAADALKVSGEIADYKLVESNQNNQLQVSQVQDLIVQKVSLIIIDPGSPTALNGAIDQAKAANIPVLIVNGGPVTDTNCYQLVFDQRAVTKAATDWTVKQLNGKGNLLLIRGISGVESDIEYYDGMQQIINQNPGIKVVGSVYGQWTDSVAQTAVAQILPSLPQVDGIVGEGGDEIGAIQAFQAAGRPIPVVSGGNRGNYLNWWNEQLQKDSNFKSYSICVDPSCAAAALYLGLDILNGKTVPQNTIYPNLEITQDNLQQYVAQKMADSDVGMINPTQDWVRQNLENQTSATLPLK